MLPFKSDFFSLTDESKQKLDTFYRHFCEGPNGKRYGIGHIVFICHASFPLLISPTLAHLIWLNFNTYSNQHGLQRIDPIVVSDFLLSPLVRKVGYKQFEIIPEIRTYLLYLLKDSSWFKLYDIEPFGPERLYSLAQFLQQYLGDKRSNKENNASGFKEINEWAALSYLEPDVLAVKMAEAFQTTFKSDKKEEAQYGQLQLNVLMNRFHEQINLNIHSKEPGDTKAFLNLHKYSIANKAELFEQSTELVSDMFYKIDEEFIGKRQDATASIQLPLRRGISERLERKKNNVKRVFGIFTAIDNYKNFRGPYLERSRGLRLYLDALEGAGKNGYLEYDPQRINSSNAVETLQKIEKCLIASNEEDVIIVYLTGLFINEHGEELFICNDSAVDQKAFLNNALSKKILQECINSVSNRGSVVLILDGCLNWMNWRGCSNILISSAREIRADSSSNLVNGGTINLFPGILANLLNTYNTTITYKDLQNILRQEMSYGRYEDALPLTPLIWSEDQQELNKYFLTNTLCEQRSLNTLYFNQRDDYWHVLEEHFKIISLNSTTRIFDYVSHEMIPDVIGEMSIRDHAIQFNGSIRDLNASKLYRAKTDRDKFSIEFGQYITTVNLEKELAPIFSKIKPDELSRWDDLQINYSSTERSELSQSVLHVDLLNLHQDSLFELTYSDKSRETSGSNVISWRVLGVEWLSVSIQRFMRYHYLSSLSSSKGNQYYLKKAHLNREVMYWWEGEKKYNKEFEDGTFSIDENCMRIENGRIVIKRLFIEMTTSELFPIYFQLYFISSDFMIKRILHDSFYFKASEPIQFSLDEQELFERVLSENTIVQIKLLFSKDPIQEDFSQPGIIKL
ncbi:hypothetical protein DBR11_14405 [Pedobacter sp. HMWF019]|uniref:hypothetical protein n=1 Tax=Pedobacter sp. HMWF019 TaxID=2056856 RepID=UPI000D3CCEF4|nr:hypothetical protein [Pedobacter sp. HMWF019]PTS98632.1 hypothetical protein DBR11_14405 [Pedobacter sp. HMWF019]